MTEAGWTVCIECGMMCEAVEYHPYAACLMFKQCLNSETVRANLQAVRDDSYHQGRVAGLRLAQEKFAERFKGLAVSHPWIPFSPYILELERLKQADAQQAQKEKGEY